MNADIKAFGKAVGAGTIAGGGPYFLFTAALAVGDFFSPIDGKANLARDFYLAVLPLLVTFPVVLLSSALIGIPTAAILGRGTDRLRQYVLVGVTAGLLIPLIVLRIAGAEWGVAFGMGLYGTLSGGVTALIWSRASATQRAESQLSTHCRH